MTKINLNDSESLASDIPILFFKTDFISLTFFLSRQNMCVYMYVYILKLEHSSRELLLNF